MASTKLIKVVLLGAFTLFLAGWLASGTYSKMFGASGRTNVEALTVLPDDKTGFVGSETCEACHEDQFKQFSNTKHAKLSNLEGWKDKVQGCESCHGPGKEHVEGGGDKTKIISFKNKNSKEISETCLACHAGKESHNNFRRGDHWRNDVGCTDCHTAHGAQYADFKPGSLFSPGLTSRETPSETTFAMLKRSEPQLCISCHSETKAQFSKPFRHKVLEGTMKCSDCHNAHGSFEQKNAKLTVGVDAACVKCHTDKQGPFVFEHAPIKVEGCSACHTPHGSANPRMLVRQEVRLVCLDCHSNLPSPTPSTASIGVTPPAFHDLRNPRYRNCTVCHSKVHGSYVDRDFLK